MRSMLPAPYLFGVGVGPMRRHPSQGRDYAIPKNQAVTASFKFYISTSHPDHWPDATAGKSHLLPEICIALCLVASARELTGEPSWVVT